MPASPLLAIHGGAGTIHPSRLDDSGRAAYLDGLRAALRAGHAVLAKGGHALDAVTEAVLALENNDLFNAGRGAVLTTDGTPEMDAAVMRGDTRAAGAVAGICGPRNPILAARAVMERTKHVLIIGNAAERIAADAGIQIEPASYFITERRQQALEAALAVLRSDGPDTRDDADRHGTVGAVARDRNGVLAAATSTGGMTAKLPGRVGDTPIFGAGTWACDTVAVSCTGTGEVFIRYAAAHEIAARIRYQGKDVRQAAREVIAELHTHGGDGGLIAIGQTGPATLPFNSIGMYRGTIGVDGVPMVAIHGESLSS